jgi:hypothetical protein
MNAGDEVRTGNVRTSLGVLYLFGSRFDYLAQGVGKPFIMWVHMSAKPRDWALWPGEQETGSTPSATLRRG